MNLQLVCPHVGALGGRVIDPATVAGGAEEVARMIAERKAIWTTSPADPAAEPPAVVDAMIPPVPVE